MRRKLIFALILTIIIMIVFIIFAPYYLIYSSQYKKADAIIVLLGPDFKARQKEAKDLAKEGMADYLIIPAYNKTYRVLKKGVIQYLPANFPERIVKKKNIVVPPVYFEDTHREIIEAKKTMSHYGLKSAIFVSSPYHMRRIRIMVAIEFDAKYSDFYFVPTHYENAPTLFWELSWADWRKVFREYGKILWFIMYSSWHN